MVNLTIDKQTVCVSENTTILEAADKIGIRIPTLCYLKEINEIGSCRVCVVEVEGIEHCVPACNSYVEEGMVVYTNSRKARKARKNNLTLLLSQHDARCVTCVRSGNCKLQTLANEMNITEISYPNEPEYKEWDSSFPLIRNTSKCVKCMRCVQICDKVQKLQVWDVTNTGSKTTVNVSKNRTIHKADCALCGQCITHCPVGALQARDDVEKVLEALEDPEIITVVQVAPAIRSAWAEPFGVAREIATEKRLAAALRRVGFDYVFDTDFGADLTIMEEGSELLERLPKLQKDGLPMFTSCCPGWIRFIKTQYPELVPQLSSAKSPQLMFGAVVKSYYAKLLGVAPEKLFVTSIMPCVAKKNECTWDGRRDVDIVLTTRELSRMLKIFSLDPAKVPEEEFDQPLGIATGAAVIFGVTGGVMEAALRSACYLVTGENPSADAFKAVRGMDGWKEAEFELAGVSLKVAAASGLGNTRRLINAILAGEVQYDFVEIMACPGGCVNGGGQPIHDGVSKKEQRAELLYDLDQSYALRFSHENPAVQQCYRDYLEKPLSHRAHELLHIDQGKILND